ncbi:MAG TPA: hypothetical protein VKY54_02815 [Kiloniellales bacterium]|nr:hypothetical protein [Kiloniellales bacterium]
MPAAADQASRRRQRNPPVDEADREPARRFDDPVPRGGPEELADLEALTVLGCVFWAALRAAVPARGTA